MPFIPSFSIIIFYDPYFYEIIFPINAGFDKFPFIFDKPNVFAIIAFKNWCRKRKQAIALHLHIKYKYVSFLGKPMK